MLLSLLGTTDGEHVKARYWCSSQWHITYTERGGRTPVSKTTC